MYALLAGGSGAAKFLSGLTQIVDSSRIVVISNTGDDTKIWGLHVSPDVDTAIYLFAGLLDEERGWGIKGDTFYCLSAMHSYGQETWFNLGDRDLATHILRTNLLRQGLTLSEVTAFLCERLGVRARVLPMSDDQVGTAIYTPEGQLSFQEFFVKRRCAVDVVGVKFLGCERARPAPGVVEAILEADAVIICPSNPITSIGPILSIKGIREAMKETCAQVIAISPIVGGKAVSGPAAKLMAASGYEASCLGVARMYRDFLDAIVIDQQDAALRRDIESLKIKAVVANVLLNSREDKIALARLIMDVIRQGRTA